MNSTLSFASIVVGQQLPPIEVEVTQQVIDRAALTHLDFNPVHTAVEWCIRAQVFGTPKTVAHGMFTMSQMASVIERSWGPHGATIRRMESKFTKPVKVGTTVRFEGSVWELHPHSPGNNTVVVSLKGTDDQGETVSVGTFRVAIPD